MDDDCLDDFICYQRDALEPVPGCGGPGEQSVDYCIVAEGGTATIAPTQLTTQAMTMTVTSEPLPLLETLADNGDMPLGICQGNTPQFMLFH